MSIQQRSSVAWFQKGLLGSTDDSFSAKIWTYVGLGPRPPPKQLPPPPDSSRPAQDSRRVGFRPGHRSPPHPWTGGALLAARGGGGGSQLGHQGAQPLYWDPNFPRPGTLTISQPDSINPIWNPKPWQAPVWGKTHHLAPSWSKYVRVRHLN